MLTQLLRFLGLQGRNTTRVEHRRPAPELCILTDDWPREDWQHLWIAHLDGRALAWGLSHEQALERAVWWVDDGDHAEMARIGTYHMQCRVGEVLDIIRLMGLAPLPSRPQAAQMVA